MGKRTHSCSKKMVWATQRHVCAAPQIRQQNGQQKGKTMRIWSHPRHKAKHLHQSLCLFHLHFWHVFNSSSSPWQRRNTWRVTGMWCMWWLMFARDPFIRNWPNASENASMSWIHKVGSAIYNHRKGHKPKRTWKDSNKITMYLS